MNPSPETCTAVSLALQQEMVRHPWLHQITIFWLLILFGASMGFCFGVMVSRMIYEWKRDDSALEGK